MKFRFALLFAAAAFAAGPASAADMVRSYDNGPVWVVSFVQTKPGHFDDYMHFLATTWKAIQEDSKKRGWVLDYKIMNAVDARDNEPDLYLLVEYKNMAVMDTSLDELDAQTKQVFGSLNSATKADVDREQIRALRGTIMARELILR